MQIQDMIELMKQMKRNGISLVELESEGSRLRLEKPFHAEAPGTAQTAEAEDTRRIAAPADSPGVQPPVQDGQWITAPVVGVYYAAPSPEDDPFVQVGSTVEAGMTVCIIEAMKLMNEVTSHAGGVVCEILVHDGQRVEYGQPLMRIGEAQ